MGFIEEKIEEFREDNKKVLQADAEKIRDAINSGEWWDIKDTVDTWSNIREVPMGDILDLGAQSTPGLSHENSDYNFWFTNYYHRTRILDRSILEPYGFEDLPGSLSQRLSATTQESLQDEARAWLAMFIGVQEWHMQAGTNPTFEEVIFKAYLDSTRFKNELEEQTLINEAKSAATTSYAFGLSYRGPTNEKLLEVAIAAEQEAIEGDLSDTTREFLEARGITKGIRMRAKVGQQMLLSNLINPFAQANRERQLGIPIDATNGNEQLYMLLGNPLFLLNKLTYNGGSDSFIDSKTGQISSLVPMIRLYKTYYDEDGETRQVELEFDNKFDSSLLGSGHHGQVGIKSFDWNLNATNPDTVRNDIEAKLVIYFQSFDDLLRKRGSGKREYSYQDLVVRPLVKSKNEDKGIEEKASTETTGNKSADSSVYEIKAVVGWAPPQSDEFWPNTDPVDQQQLAMFLTLIDHEFSFTQEGTFELQITYRARLEELVESPKFDVLSNAAGKARLDELRSEISELRSECGVDNSESIKKKENSLREQKKVFRDNFSKSIMNTLMDNLNVHTMKNYSIGDLARLEEGKSIEKVITEGDVRDSLINSDRHKTDKGRQIYGFPGQEESPAATTAVDKTKTLSDSYPIAWFYFGDLVKAVIKHTLSLNEHSSVDEENRHANKLKGLISKNLSMLLGSITIREVVEGRETDLNVNLGDLPISVSFFNKWFTRHVVETRKGSFPLIEFMRNTVNNLCVGSLRQGQKIGSKKANRYLVKSTTFSLPSFSPDASSRGISALGPHPLSQYSEVPSIETTYDIEPVFEEGMTSYHQEVTYESPAFPTNEIERVINTDNIKCSLDSDAMDRTKALSMSVDNSYHCMMFYVLTDNGYGAMRGPGTDEEERAMSWVKRDRRNGIHHLYIGADRGLLKEISFSKNDQPFLREARLQQDELNPLAQLAATYDANLNLVGNTIFWPGQYVYINPLGFGTGIGHPYKRGTPANQLGLGGYHLITEVRSYIEGGKFETSIKALFTTSGDGGSVFGESKTFSCSEGPDNSNAKTSKN
jgi:hypothetical protein